MALPLEINLSHLLNPRVNKDPGFQYRPCIKVGTFESPAHPISVPQGGSSAQAGTVGPVTSASFGPSSRDGSRY